VPLSDSCIAVISIAFGAHVGGRDAALHPAEMPYDIVTNGSDRENVRDRHVPDMSTAPGVLAVFA